MTTVGGPEDVRICAVCGNSAPSTDTAYTLISARYGWRVVFEKDASGKRVSAWRCPDCWNKEKPR